MRAAWGAQLENVKPDMGSTGGIIGNTTGQRRVHLRGYKKPFQSCITGNERCLDDTDLPQTHEDIKILLLKCVNQSNIISKRENN